MLGVRIGVGCGRRGGEAVRRNSTPHVCANEARARASAERGLTYTGASEASDTRAISERSERHQDDQRAKRATPGRSASEASDTRAISERSERHQKKMSKRGERRSAGSVTL